VSFIPLVDLEAQYEAIRSEIDAAIRRVVESRRFILGPEVVAFEEAFAAYCGVRYAVGVASGTAALDLALRACGIGQGDEVITTAMTFVATVGAIRHVGATPVLVDIDPRTYNIDPTQIESMITSQTKAIVPVHLHGQPADMDPILEIARAHGLRVIEDAAQAHGALYKGRRAGSMGDAAIFSFYPGKNLGAYGDAGAVVTDDEEIATFVRLARDHGRTKKYVHEAEGFNERMDGLQGAILRAKLAHLDDWNEARRAHAARYRALLRDLDLVLPYELPGARSVYHIFCIRVQQRDAVLEGLRAMGIGAGVHYPIPIHLQPAFAYLGYAEGAFPVAEEAGRQFLSLPLYPELTDALIRRVADAVRALLEG
jgi:dTDP-4-amino-4,6-dideoxygalactose transaminase